MRGIDHYHAAELLLDAVGQPDTVDSQGHPLTQTTRQLLIHTAGVHAQLAVAATFSRLTSIARHAEQAWTALTDEQIDQALDLTRAEPLVKCGQPVSVRRPVAILGPDGRDSGRTEWESAFVGPCVMPVGHEGGCSDIWESISPAEVLNESIESGTPITVTDDLGRCGSRPYPAGSEGDDGTQCVLGAGHDGPCDDGPVQCQCGHAYSVHAARMDPAEPHGICLTGCGCLQFTQAMPAVIA